MTAKASVLIVDDHPLVREGLAMRIAAQPDMVVCGEAASTEEALTLLRTAKPAVAIVDLALKKSHGLDLIKKVRKEAPSVSILVVSAYEEALFAERVIRAGARGYVNKQEAQNKVIDAIRAVLRGELYLSAEIAQRLVDPTLEPKAARQGVESLSDREIEVFQLIGRGSSTRSIAEQLGISIHTVETHRENIRSKLGLHNAAELVHRAVQWSLETG